MCPVALVMDGDVPPAAKARCCGRSDGAAAVLESIVRGVRSGIPCGGSASPSGQAGPGSAAPSAEL